MIRQEPAGAVINPFPGLRPFEFEENLLFFGRDGQTEALIHKLSGRRFVVVIGMSGSGKSSLVRAGLLPALVGGVMTAAGSHWRVAIMRPGSTPIRNLAIGLAGFGSPIAADDTQDSAWQVEAIEPTLRAGGLGLVQAVRHAGLAPEQNLLLLVDQFEEIFRFSRDDNAYDENAAFIKLLIEAKTQREVPIYIVLTMRSDFVGECARFYDLPEAINEGQFLIPRLTRDQRRAAITGPIAVAGAAIAPRLVDQLLNDAGDDPSQLPILQHALMRTWEAWKTGGMADQPLDQSHYMAIGGMSHALSLHCEEAFASLAGADRAIAEGVFKCLTEKGADQFLLRRPTSLQEIGEICAISEADLTKVIQVIETFNRPGRSLLVPPAGVPLMPESVIDIAHESLILGWPRLRRWVDEEADSARMYLRLSEAAAFYDVGAAGLWRNPELQLALMWRDQNRPNAAWARRYDSGFDRAQAFLTKSQKALEEERRAAHRAKTNRTRAFAALLGLLGLVTLWVGGYAWRKRGEAQQQRIVAERNAAEASRQKELAEDIARRAEAARLDALREQEDLSQAAKEAKKPNSRGETR